MAEILPFRALRYAAPVAADLARVLAPPYDVITTELQDALYARHLENVVRLELTRAPADVDRYAIARMTLDDWRAGGVLRVDATPALYLLDHVFVHRGRALSRRGIFCALRLAEWDERVVLPHERTFSGPKLDRLQLLRALRVNTSPVFLLYDDARGEVAQALSAARPRLAAQARSDGEELRLFRLDAGGAIDTVRRALEPRRLYVADGHHRYETALEFRREDPRADATLAYLVAIQDPGLLILPTHRIVRGGSVALAEAAARHFDGAVVDAGALEDQQPAIALAREGRIAALTPRAGAPMGGIPPAWRDLPVAQAEELLVRPAREAGAEVTYTHDTGAALHAARGDVAGLLLRAADVDTLVRVADQGERLPQKTTYFHPKVPTGLVLRPLDE